MRLIDYAFILLMGFGLLSMSAAVTEGRSPFPSDWFPSPLAAGAFDFVLALWVLAEVYNNVASMRNQSGQRKDKGSYWVVILGLWLLMAAVIYLRIQGIGSFAGDAQYLGLLIALAGILIREAAVLTLGGGFTVRVETKKGRRLTTHGLYSYLRHPSYTGSILTLIGLPLAIGSWAGALAAAVISFGMYSYRIKVEEEALHERYGKEYEEYSKKSWRLFPGY